jgi:hypothetical protein
MQSSIIVIPYVMQFVSNRGTILRNCYEQSVSFLGSRDSIVGIAIRYGLEDRGIGVRVPVVSRIFSSPRRPERALGSTQPPIQWVPGALSPGGRAAGA